MIKDQVEEMMQDFKNEGIPASSVEAFLGFSNGLLGKGSLSEEKFAQLKKYHSVVMDKKGITHRYCVYKLINPITGIIFYVGVTSKPLEVRLYGHISEALVNYSSPKKGSIIREIVKNGYSPVIEAIEEFNGSNLDELCSIAMEREKYWIMHLIESGHPLTNRVSKAKLLMNNTQRLKTINSGEGSNTEETKEKIEIVKEAINRLSDNKRPSAPIHQPPIAAPTLEQIKNRCPMDLTGIHRTIWIHEEKAKYGLNN